MLRRALARWLLWADERRTLELHRAFEHYLKPELVETIMATPREPTWPSGEERQLTILFSDIPGFTRVSEPLSPTAVADFLNVYLTEMTEAIFKHGGTLDKYMGDTVMAFWGAPYPQLDHAVRACRAALEMQQAVVRLQRHWEAQGFPAMQVDVGVNTGPMWVGNVGSRWRMQYTVIGSNANLAVRLLHVNRIFGTHLIMGENTFEAVRDEMLARDLDLVKPKGCEQPVRVYELVGTRAEAAQHRDRVDRFASGLQAYRENNWKSALQIFEALARDYPRDGPTRVFIGRCQDFSRKLDDTTV